MDLDIESWTPIPRGPIPTYCIDLSLPPQERYTQLSTDFGGRMRDLVPLFDRILSWSIPFSYPRRFIKFLASIFLRRVFSDEETEEMKGIAKMAGVDMFIVVALNVLLDSLLGCTSGGVLVRGKKRKGKNGEEESQVPKMMHFRTLDWGMDGLKNLLVTLEFVRSKSSEPERVIARSITYAGFVGVLTGVRQDLSISLNFRPVHYCSAISLRAHQLLVLLGFRPSIASHLRSALLPSEATAPLPELSQSVKTLRAIKSSPCYLILCSGKETTVIERDLSTSKLRTSSQFIVHTNHDKDIPTSTPSQTINSAPVGLDFWIEDSEYRAECVATKWEAVKIKHENKQNEEPALKAIQPSIVEETLINWVKTYPVMNETSHFGCVMDPSKGRIVMMERDGFKKHRPNVVLTMN